MVIIHLGNIEKLSNTYWLTKICPFIVLDSLKNIRLYSINIYFIFYFLRLVSLSLSFILMFILSFRQILYSYLVLNLTRTILLQYCLSQVFWTHICVWLLIASLLFFNLLLAEIIFKFQLILTLFILKASLNENIIERLKLIVFDILVLIII